MRSFLILSSLVLALAATSCGSSSSGGILSGKGAASGDSSAGAPQATKASGGSISSTPAATAKATGTTTAGTPNPCSILSKDDAAATLGQPVNDGKLTESTGPLGQRLCFYSAADAGSTASVQLSLITTSGLTDQMKKNGWSAKQQYDSEKKLSASTPVSSLGEDAFIRCPNLYVLKGETDVNLMLLSGASGTQEQAVALKALALRVLPKLP